jgi:hypothetical protein
VGLRDRLGQIRADLSLRPSGRAMFPGDIVEGLAECGRQEWSGDGGFGGYGPYLPEIQHSSPEQQRSWVAELANVALPLGGWTVFGAAQTVVTSLGTSCVEIPEACAIVDASLAFQREAGVWLTQLSIFEKMHWEARHPDEAWLSPRKPPSREAAVITPIPVGTERRVAVMSRISDSNEIYVAHAATGEYVAILDMPVARGEDCGRTRQENDRDADLYKIYWSIGQNVFFPNHWNDPELEPFFRFSHPRI